MSVKTVLSNENTIFTIIIQGAFDFSLVHEFRKSYAELQSKEQSIVIDFRDTIHIDSSALGMLLNLKRNINAADHDIKIINARSDVKKILHIAHFEKMFDIS